MMHDHKNIKLCDAKQAKQVYHYKNIKLKLYKNNAAIWFNKTCKDSQFSFKLYTDRPPRTLVESDGTICCMYTTVSS